MKQRMSQGEKNGLQIQTGGCWVMNWSINVLWLLHCQTNDEAFLQNSQVDPPCLLHSASYQDILQIECLILYVIESDL